MSAAGSVAGEPAGVQPFFRSRWVPAPAHVRELGPDAGLPAGFRAAGVACGHEAERQARPRAAGVRRPSSPARAPPASPRGHARRAGARQPASAAGCTRCGRCSPTRAARTPRPAGAGLDDAAKTQGAAALAAGVDPRPRWRSPRPAAISQLPAGRRDAERDPAARIAAAPRRATATSSARSRRPTASRSAPTSRSSCPSGTRATERPVQGRGDDLAALRDDALLRADRRRVSAPRRPSCCSACASKRSFDRASRRRAAVDQRHGDPDVLGRERRGGRPRERGRAAPRRGARRAAAPARDHDGRRRRGRRADRARASCAAGTPRASRRSPARSPTRRS